MAALPGQQIGKGTRPRQLAAANSSPPRPAALHQLAYANYTRPGSHSPPPAPYGPIWPPTAPAPGGGMRSRYAVKRPQTPGKGP